MQVHMTAKQQKILPNGAGGGYRHIYAFEPDEKFAEKCKDNLCDMKNWEIIRKGLWDKDTVLSFVRDPFNPMAAHIEEGETKKTDMCVEVTSLDVCLERGDIMPPTFIKMDIEGAESKALLGMEKIIRTFRPKLAVSVYHKPEDIVEIPLQILRYEPSYQFYMRHCNFCLNDTVLYAI